MAAATACVVAAQMGQNFATAERSDDVSSVARAIDVPQRATSREIGLTDVAGDETPDAFTDGGIAGSGADVAVCTLPEFSTYPRLGDIHSFSLATNSFNVGDEDLQWVSSSSNHPVIAQNMYRIKGGRIEMIGMAWLKHGFCALQQSGCGPCQVQGGCLSYLKPGCADPYSSSLNGQQSNLGPRSDVNASTVTVMVIVSLAATAISPIVQTPLTSSYVPTLVVLVT